MVNINDKTGILYKVNPPLRHPETRKKLFKKFVRGEIDILETDHAPHTLDEKTGALDSQGKPQYMSGIPGLASWPDFLRILIKRKANPDLIKNMTHENVNRIFGTNIPELNLPVTSESLTGEYAFDAYKNLK
jgi:dihydroorotase